jgi:hypothetical protein
MRLIKVLFLFVFIISVNSYVSQGTYQLDQVTTSGSLTAELYISEYSPNQNIQCKDSIDGRAKIEITSGSGPLFRFKWYTNNGVLLRDNTTSNPSDSLVEIGEMSNSYVLIYVSGALKMNFVFSIESSPNILLIAPTLKLPDCFEDVSGSLDSNGSITATKFFGAGTPSFQWDDPSSSLNATANNFVFEPGPKLLAVAFNDEEGSSH